MASEKRVLVIGSGLAAYGACLALIESKEIKIDVIDIGLNKNYINQPNMPAANAKDIKSSFFPYGINDKRWNLTLRSKRICSSHALGGFSKVWSGSVLQPKISDLVKWPPESIPSAKDYEKIIKSINIAQIKDELNAVFPINPNKLSSVKKGTFIGRSRIAYDQIISSDSKIETIPFDTSLVFEKWAKAGLISYCNNNFVTYCRLNSTNKYEVFVDKRKDPLKNKYDAVYLAAGCVNTTAIVDKSLNGSGKRKYSIISAPFLLQTYLKLGKKSKIKKLFKGKDNYGLCEYFLESCSKLTLNQWSHTQIGPINSILIKKLSKVIPKKFKFIIAFVKSNLKFSITNFHSDHAPRISLTSIVKSEGELSKHTIIIDEEDYECTNQMYLAIKLAVISKFKKLQLIPIPFSKLLGNTLKENRLGSWHFGGTIPMTNNKEDGGCSVDGEVYGLKNLYIIDSSSFPSIPGSTIGLLTMANSYRITRNSMNSL